MDKQNAEVLKRRGVSDAGAPEGFVGVAYDVAIIWEGALDDNWVVESVILATEQAEALAAEFADEDAPVEVVVSEVYLGEDVIEPTGQMIDDWYRNKAARKQRGENE